MSKALQQLKQAIFKAAQQHYDDGGTAGRYEIEELRGMDIEERFLNTKQDSELYSGKTVTYDTILASISFTYRVPNGVRHDPSLDVTVSIKNLSVRYDHDKGVFVVENVDFS